MKCIIWIFLHIQPTPVDAGTIHHECESSLALTHGYNLELEVRNEYLIHFFLPRKKLSFSYPILSPFIFAPLNLKDPV